MNVSAWNEYLESIQQVLNDNDETNKAMHRLKKSYEDTRDNVLAFRDKLHHEVMVPVGPKAFFKGTMIHTNEYMAALSPQYFIKMSAKEVAELCDRRLNCINEGIENVRKSGELLTSRLDFTQSELADKTEEIIEEFDEEKEQAWRAQHAIRVRKERQQEKMISEMQSDASFERRLEELLQEEQLSNEPEVDTDESDDSLQNMEEEEKVSQLLGQLKLLHEQDVAMLPQKGEPRQRRVRLQPDQPLKAPDDVIFVEHWAPSVSQKIAAAIGTPTNPGEIYQLQLENTVKPCLRVRSITAHGDASGVAETRRGSI